MNFGYGGLSLRRLQPKVNLESVNAKETGQVS
jgi:hypothetical protein